VEVVNAKIIEQEVIEARSIKISRKSLGHIVASLEFAPDVVHCGSTRRVQLSRTQLGGLFDPP
jgi:hypothetical protein